MRPKNIGASNKDIESKSTHALNPADIKPNSQKLTTIHSNDPATRDQAANSKRIANSISARRPNFGRHAAKCRICSHPKREEIEQDYIAFESLAKIANDYGLGDRTSIHRHGHALGLSGRRQRNVRVPLERIIEQAGNVKANASAIVSAVLAYAKINARGELIERDEDLTLQNLIDRMSAEELDAYAKHRILPTWFKNEIVAAGGRVPEEDDDA